MYRMNKIKLLLFPLWSFSFSACVFLIPMAQYEEDPSASHGGYGDPSFSQYRGDSPHRGGSPYINTKGSPNTQLKTLIENLYSSKDVVRVHAASDLGALGAAASPAVPTLNSVLIKDPSKWVRRSAAKALARIGDKRGIPALERAGRDRDRYVAHSANRALRRLKRR
jgi:hypothetical protein